MMKWGLGGFRVGKEIETVLDQAIQAAQQPEAPAPPDPKVEAEIAEMKAKTKQALASAEKSWSDSAKANAETLLLFGSYPAPPELAGFGVPRPAPRCTPACRRPRQRRLGARAGRQERPQPPQGGPPMPEMPPMQPEPAQAGPGGMPMQPPMDMQGAM